MLFDCDCSTCALVVLSRSFASDDEARVRWKWTRECDLADCWLDSARRLVAFCAGQEGLLAVMMTFYNCCCCAMKEFWLLCFCGLIWEREIVGVFLLFE